MSIVKITPDQADLLAGGEPVRAKDSQGFLTIIRVEQPYRDVENVICKCSDGTTKCSYFVLEGRLHSDGFLEFKRSVKLTDYEGSPNLEPVVREDTDKYHHAPGSAGIGLRVEGRGKWFDMIELT